MVVTPRHLPSCGPNEGRAHGGGYPAAPHDGPGDDRRRGDGSQRHPGFPRRLVRRSKEPRLREMQIQGLLPNDTPAMPWSTRAWRQSPDDGLAKGIVDTRQTDEI
jgi:hypothetical protein